MVGDPSDSGTEASKEIRKLANDKKKMLRVITFLKDGMIAINDAFDTFSSTMKDFSSSLKKVQKDLKGVFDEDNIEYLSASVEMQEMGSGKYKRQAANTLAQLLMGKTDVTVSATSSQPASTSASPAAPSAGPPTKGPPSSEPPTKGPPSSGPPTKGPPSSGPPTKGPPTKGPPSSGPPTKGPPSAGPPSAGLPKAPPAPSAGPPGNAPKVSKSQLNTAFIRNEMMSALNDLKSVLGKK